MSRQHRSLLISLLMIFVFFAGANAQTSTATLKGSVADSSGNVTPGATITLTSRLSGLKKVFSTDSAGQYTFTFLEPGVYTLEAQAKGFKQYRNDNIQLAVGQSAELDLSLEPGDISETVTITAGETSLQLDTGSASLGGVIERSQVDALPLNGRNVLQLAQLEPGVNSSPGSRRANPGLGAVGEIAINGGRPLTNEIVIDGVSVTAKADNLPALKPSPDAVQEFRIVTNSYSAEYGRTGGGALNFSIRSGGSQFRGTLWEYLRNDAFDATTFFSNFNGTGKEKLRFNQFGGNFGGPAYLPRFGQGGPAVAKASKVFFFVNYERLRVSQANLRQSTVPTAKIRTGDFSELLGANLCLNATNAAGVCGGAFTNPLNVRNTANQTLQARVGMIYAPGAVVPAGQPGAGSRVVFANNIIPANQLNTVGKNLMNYYPLPNRSGLALNYVVNSPINSTDNQVTVRLDYNISQKHSLYCRIIKEKNNSTNQGTYPGLITSVQNNAFNNQGPGSAVIDYIWTMTPKTIFHANVGATRFDTRSTQPSIGFDPATLGFAANLANASGDSKVFPTIAPVGYSQLGPNRNFGIAINSQDTFTFTEDVSLLRGAHTIKFGGNQRFFTIYNYRTDDPAGNFNFTRAFTARTANDTNSGDAMASILLGNPSAGRIAIAPQPAVGSKYFSFFLQDDWVVNKSLTLNLGLRYELDLPNTERFNRLSTFDYQAQFPISSITVAFPASTNLGTKTIPLFGVLRPVGRGGVTNREQSDRDYNNLAPRIGLAWKITEKTVLRAGGGIFFSSISGGGLSNASYAIADLVETGFVPSLDNGVTPNPGANLSNPFPNGIVQPTSQYGGPLSGYGQNLPVRIRELRMPVVPQWNLNLQRELPGKIIVQASYAGSAGIGLLSAQNALNQLKPDALALGETILNTRVNNPFLALPADQRPPTTAVLNTATLTIAQLLRPYPQFGQIQSSGMNEGHSTYHSLQLKGQRRFSNGLSFTVGYTFAKLIDDISSLLGNFTTQSPYGQDYNNRRADKSLSAFDVRHRLTANIVWQLPFGPGRAYLKNGVAGYVLGGWGINGILQAQGGLPLAISAANPAALQNLSFIQLRPNLVGDPVLNPDTREQQVNAWFNTAAFTAPANFTFGNSPRLMPNLRGPGHFSTNLSLARDFRFTETIRLQFRAEGFNIFNRPNFTVPGTVVGTPTFGRLLQTEDARQMQFALRLYF
ncbi:MAG: TonB-dependent receptor [Acidobacteria bacterium]|nr:TonB-dependent receptor [Acidobacteriota bacterium]